MNGEELRASEEARNLWREAKQQLNVYEEKSLELRLAYQTEQNALQAAKTELNAALQDVKDISKRMASTQGSKAAAQKRILELTQQSLAAATDTQRLTAQLAMERRELQADQHKLEELRSQFLEHLQSTRSYIEDLRGYAKQKGTSSELLR